MQNTHNFCASHAIHALHACNTRITRNIKISVSWQKRFFHIFFHIWTELWYSAIQYSIVWYCTSYSLIQYQTTCAEDMGARIFCDLIWRLHDGSLIVIYGTHWHSNPRNIFCWSSYRKVTNYVVSIVIFVLSLLVIQKKHIVVGSFSKEKTQNFRRRRKNGW